MHRYLIVYDIVENRTRKIVSDILEGYGERVNKSVFECSFKNKKSKDAVIQRIEAEIDPKRDSVRIYAVCRNCLHNSHTLGDHEDAPFTIQSVYFTS